MDEVNSKGVMSIQWHITSRCGKRCRHCYMYEDKRYEEEIKNESSFDKLIEILNDIESFEKRWNFSIKDFFITGGDPLLRNDYKDFLSELHSRNKNISIMGNPETLTVDNLEFLRDIGIRQFQMSLDGLEETHDYFRGEGSFQRTVKALELLDSYNIKGTIMFTLTNENKSELVPLLNFVANNTSAKGFAFDLVCGVGNAKNLDTFISSSELKEIFNLYLIEKESIKRSKINIHVAEKPKLFQLIHYENNDFYPYDSEEFNAASGCYVGYTCYTILADGSVAACRRFPLIIGKMPEQKMEDIFLGNSELKKFRRAEYYKKCGTCKFYKYCRGCPAVSYGFYQDPFAENPQCFLDTLKNVDNINENSSEKLDTSKEEEAMLVKSLLINKYITDYDKFIENDEVLIIIGSVLSNSNERKMFFRSPKKYIEDNGLNISDKYIAYICYYIDCILRNKIANPIKYALDV